MRQTVQHKYAACVESGMSSKHEQICMLLAISVFTLAPTAFAATHATQCLHEQSPDNVFVQKLTG